MPIPSEEIRSSSRRETWVILRNDVRLSWREFSLGRFKTLSNVGILSVSVAAFHGLALLVFWARGQPPSAFAEAVAWGFLLILMLGASIRSAGVLLVERGDVDLLLASPVAARSVLLARLTAIIVRTASSAAMFLLPLVDSAAIMFSPTYLFAYVVWVVAAAFLSCVGIAIMLLLVRWLGTRRASTWGQVLGVLLGMSVYALAQLPALLQNRFGEVVSAKFRLLFASRALGALVQAAHGRWPMLLMFGALTFAALWATARFLSRLLVEGLRETSATPAGRPAKHHFADPVFIALVRKDLRLLARNPLLMVRLVPIAVSLTLLGVLVVRVFHVTIPGALAVTTVVAIVLFSTMITTLTIATDEGWELMQSSPMPQLHIRCGKICAGMTWPVVLSFIAVGAVAVLGRPGLASLAFLDGLMAAAAASWIEVASMEPRPRNADVHVRLYSSEPGPERSLAVIVLTFGSGGAAALVAGGYLWLSVVAFLIVGITAIVSFLMIELCGREAA